MTQPDSLKRYLHGNCGVCGFDGMLGEAAYRAHDCRAELTKQILAEQATRPAATDGSALRDALDSISEAKKWIDHKDTCPCWNSNLGWKWCDCGFERLNDALTDAIDKLSALRANLPADGGK